MTWITERASGAPGPAKGTNGALHIVACDVNGNPLGGSGGVGVASLGQLTKAASTSVTIASDQPAIQTYETAAIGYDPSTGRTPVELTNNVYYKTATVGVSESIKSAPGFVHSISATALWTGTPTGPTHLLITLFDAVSATNPVLIKRVPATVSLGNAYASFDIVLDGIFATGIFISIATADGSGATLSGWNTTVTYR